MQNCYFVVSLYVLLSPLYLSSSLFCIRTHRRTDGQTALHTNKGSVEVLAKAIEPIYTIYGI
jgi:hypothetical protein